MVTPEIDWWIKNTTQVKNPVYNRKRYAQSVPTVFGDTVQTPINQDENIKLVLITDILVSFCGTIEKPCEWHVVSIVDQSLGKLVYQWFVNDSDLQPLYLNNINYLQEGERLNLILSGGGSSFNRKMSVGYIEISSKT